MMVRPEARPSSSCRGPRKREEGDGSVIADWTFRIERLLRGPLAVRRTQLYCVGTAKSGTHSLCAMFSRNVRAGHERRAEPLIDKFFERQEGRIGEGEWREWIHARDRELALEVDSSWFHILMLDVLAQDFPHARFVLTIRDCYSWLNSELKRVLHRPTQNPRRIRMRRFLYERPGATYAPEERVLQDTALYPIDSYLARWTAHNEQVLATIPEERLLVVRTGQIRARAHEIADFAGLPRHAVRLERTHEYRNPVARELIREIDRDFLEHKVAQQCRPLMERFFPDIRTVSDAKL
jgi:hypothetical protein